jgi:glycosyltransferase involved in cell wall biosynthesis
LYRSSLSGANEVWFLNQEDRTLFVEQEIVSKFKTRVINGEGVNLEHYKPVTNSSKQKFSFLFIGRVLWDKGVGEFVEAAKVVKKQHPHVQFNVLGPLGASNPASISQEQMEQWERLGVVRYLGETTDVIPYISSASCIVLPSYREGISRVLLESAAMERPIIASNVPGCREIVLNGESGFLCEPQNVSSLIACMMHMLSLSTEDCINFGKKGRMHVKELYDEQLTINLYKNRLNELLPE